MAEKILCIIDDRFDERELVYPAYRVKEEGYEIVFAGPEKRVFKGKEGMGQEVSISFDEINVDDYAGLLIPGGYAPGAMRANEAALAAVKKFNEDKKPIGMICHAGWVGASADIIQERKVTSTPSIREDMESAGGDWHDEAPVVDGNLITARNPGDLHVYVKAFLDVLKK